MCNVSSLVSIEETRKILQDQRGADAVADLANKDGRYYAPAIEDRWFKFASGSDGNVVSEAFVQTAITLSFRSSSSIDVASQVDVALLSSKPEENRNFATDFACAVRFKQGIKRDQKNQIVQDFSKQHDGQTEGQSRSAILKDVTERGMIVLSEMQKSDAGDMVDRAYRYIRLKEGHDSGNGSANGRLLKQTSDGEFPRSIAEVVWIVDKKTAITQDVQCPAVKHAQAIDSTISRGNIVTFVPLIDVPSSLLKSDRRTEEFQGEVKKLITQMNGRIDVFFNNATGGTIDLVKQMTAVINFSHLMWPELVKTFLPAVQNMCDRLRITGDNIMDKVDSAYIQGLVGEFQATREAQQRAEQSEIKRKNTVKFYQKLGGNKDPKVRQTLLKKYKLTERDLEVSSDATPKNSPSKPKAEDLPSPSRK
jgi:23S rRNA pseudoU1915 N3-methylase RlmH